MRIERWQAEAPKFPLKSVKSVGKVLHRIASHRSAETESVLGRAGNLFIFRRLRSKQSDYSGHVGAGFCTNSWHFGSVNKGGVRWVDSGQLNSKL